MNAPALRIVLTFSPDDAAWLRRSSIVVPSFWDGHTVAPMEGDVLRIGGRQFTVKGCGSTTARARCCGCS